MGAEIFGFGKNLGFELLLGPGKPAFLNRLLNLGIVERGNRRERGNTEQDQSGHAIFTPQANRGVSAEYGAGFSRVFLKSWRRWLHGMIPLMSPTVSQTGRDIAILKRLLK